MNSGPIIIKCLCLETGSLDILHQRLKRCRGHCTSEQDHIVDLKIRDKNIRIYLTEQWTTEEIKVCLISWWTTSSKYFRDKMQVLASLCDCGYPTIPIIIVGFDAGVRSRLKALQQMKMEGVKPLNRETGNQLAREIGAVKYVEISLKNGRGIKLLLNEIAYAGLGKIKDQHQREKDIKERKGRQKAEERKRRQREACEKRIIKAQLDVLNFLFNVMISMIFNVPMYT